MPRSRSLGPVSTLCVALLALYGPPTRAQSSDSLDLLRRARNAQRDFEQLRRANLHRDRGGGSHPCEARIGRFCYWYQPFSKPPPESAAIGRARARLLRDLAAAGRRLPGDDWILGQRVRYLVEHSRADLAVVLTRACRATRWWCDALEGFARHAGRDYEGADHAFDRALRGMRAEQRCAWTDLSTLLRDADRPYRALPCAEHVALDERIWWLAHPLYSRVGNDLRTEHYARHTMALLLEHAETLYGLPGASTRASLSCGSAGPRTGRAPLAGLAAWRHPRSSATNLARASGSFRHPSSQSHGPT